MKRFQRFWSSVLAFSMTLSCLTVFGGLNLFAANEIEISTAAQLRQIGLTSAYPLNGNYVLTADIDLSDADWDGIAGSASAARPLYPDSETEKTSGSDYFTGTIDGQNHKILGMHYGSESEPKSMTSEYWAFINAIGYGAAVRNLVFEDVYFNGYRSNSYTEVGVVAGFARYGAQIENVAVLSGTLSDDNHLTARIRMGGIVGAITRAEASDVYTIRNCFSAVNITANNGGTHNQRHVSIAGIIGSIAASPTLTVDSCVNAGVIRTESDYLASGSTYYSSVSAIASRGRYNDAAFPATVTVTNCYTLENCVFSADANAVSTRDNGGTTVVAAAAAGAVASYPNLNVDDWAVAADRLPIPTAFAADALIPIADKTALAAITTGNYPATGHYVLLNDIDLSGENWIGIGRTSATGSTIRFCGHFDGRGHCISNMTGSGTVNEMWGLFCILTYGATVENLAFENVSCNVTSNQYLADIGTVCGLVQGKAGGSGSVLFRNIVVRSGSLAADSSYTGTKKLQLREGGILGAVGNTATPKVTIRNCYNGAAIDIDESSQTGTVDYFGLGGILGYSTKVLTIDSCVNVGTIGENTASSKKRVSDIAAGNLGSNSVVSNCYSLSGTASSGTLRGTTFTMVQAAGSTTYAPNLSESVWTLQQGYYPMLSAFADYKVSVDWGEALTDLFGSLTLTNDYTAADAQNYLLSLGCSAAVEQTAKTLATEETSGSLSLKITLEDESVHHLDLTIPAIPQIAYTFDKTMSGIAQGTVTVTLGEDYSKGNYALWWGTESGILPGFTVLANMSDFTVSGNTLTYKTAEWLIFPEDATHLWLTVDGVRAVAYEIPEERRTLDQGALKYRFGLVSDVHFSPSTNGVERFTAAMNFFENNNATFVATAGDFTNGGYRSQVQMFADAYAAGGWTIPVWTCVGNHDTTKWVGLASNTITPGDFFTYLSEYMPTYPTYDSNDPSKRDDVITTKTFNGQTYTYINPEADAENYGFDYAVKYSDDLFVYLGIGLYTSGTGKNTDQHLAQSQLTWLDSVLADYYKTADATGHAFVIFHYYTYESGLGVNSSWSKPVADANGVPSMPDWNSSRELDRILKKYPNVVHMHGHTHHPFSLDYNISTTESWELNTEDNIYYRAAETSDLGYTSLHIPTLGKDVAEAAANIPIFGEYTTTIAEEDILYYQGYLVSVYENGVRYSGYNLNTGEKVAYVDFFVPDQQPDIPAKFPVQIAKDAADTVAETDTVASFEIAGVQVRTADPAGIRFVARMSTSLLNELKTMFGEDNVSYGILLQKTANTGEELTEANVTGGSVGSGAAVLVPGANTFITYDDYLYYTAVITGMPASEYDTQITARAYVKCGDTYYFATEADGSTYAVAGAAANAGGYSVSLKQAAQYIVSNQLESWEAVQALYGDHLN